MSIGKDLQDEITERISAMEVTGDIPAGERYLTALEDIIALSAEDHGAYTAKEIASWKKIQRAARQTIKQMGMK